MKMYYINKTKDSNGKNEVHTSTCYWLSLADSTQYLGEFKDGIDAVSYAKRIGYSDADGCYYCSSEAHSA